MHGDNAGGDKAECSTQKAELIRTGRGSEVGWAEEGAATSAHSQPQLGQESVRIGQRGGQRMCT